MLSNKERGTNLCGVRNVSSNNKWKLYNINS